MTQSSGSPAPRKVPDRPKKPYAGFPLTPHSTGTWQKKIRGKIYYFGKWARRVDGTLTRIPGDGWKEALEQYKAQADDLHAGRTPRAKKDGLTVADLCNQFLTAKYRKVEAKELTPRMYADYKELTDLVVKQFSSNRLVDDLAADDFATLRAAMAKKWGPVRLGVSVVRIKTVFKFGYESGAMERPVRYGPEFVKPDPSVLRRHPAKSAPKMFTAAELRTLADGALVVTDDGPQLVRPDAALRAMILLGVNCGFGNTDCAGLTFTGLDLDRAWLDYPRPKTGIARRCPLWPETVAAIRAAVETRPKPCDFPECGRVFLTARGSAFIKIAEIEKTEDGKGTRGGHRNDLIGTQFLRLLTALGLRRTGVGFYSLRHVFETVGGGSKDQVAVDAVMGHADPSMAGHYREEIADARLRAVVDHVRAWLWPQTAEATAPLPA